MSSRSRSFALAAALLLALATGVGALNAHQVSGRLGADAQRIVEIGVQYQFYHSLGLLGIALLLERLPGQAVRATALLRAAGWLLISGIVLFSGSLYALAAGMSGALRTAVGVLTPFGGLSMILGWCAAALGIAQSRSV
jgi:uncharacterized membrane protein YgdD (TMEM256/DUF423 family)